MLLRLLLVVCFSGFVPATPAMYEAHAGEICADSWECHLGGREAVSLMNETLAPVLTAGAETKPTLLERLGDLLLACFETRGCLAQPDTLALYLMETP